MIVYVVIGHTHYGGDRMVGVFSSADIARARCKSAGRDPNLYLSSCDVHAWEVDASAQSHSFTVWPSSEDAAVMRAGRR